MALDIAGMLTGVSQQPVNPNLSVQQQQLAMGANANRMMQGGVESMRRSAGGAAPVSEQLQMALSQLDLSNPADLAKLAQIQQATGDLAGAAQTASKIQAIKQAKVEEGRAVSREDRAQQTFNLGKEDRLEQKVKDADLLKRQLAQQTREERRLVLQEENASDRKLLAKEALSDKEKTEATAKLLRTVYEDQARTEGRESLADAIKAGLPIASIPSILYKTSTAQVTMPKGDEKDAFMKILESKAMQAKLPAVLSLGIEIGKTSDATDDAIFYKTKEIRQSRGNQISIEDAMALAIDAIASLQTTPEDKQKDADADAKAEEQNALLKGGPTVVGSNDDEDPFAGI